MVAGDSTGHATIGRVLPADSHRIRRPCPRVSFHHVPLVAPWSSGGVALVNRAPLASYDARRDPLEIRLARLDSCRPANQDGARHEL